MLSGREREDLLARLRELARKADAFHKAMPPNEGGRPRDERVYGLIWALASAYADVTGKKPTITYSELDGYSGPFYHFVWCVFNFPVNVFDDELAKSGLALGRITQRALAKWKRHLDRSMDKT